MRSLIPKFLFLFLVSTGFYTAVAQTNLNPIKFNTGEEKITLVYKVKSINDRLDTFDIDLNRSVKYLKQAIQKHYDIKVPAAWSQRLSDGGYSIESILRSNHRSLYNEDSSMSESGIDTLDIIEFDYEVSQRATMACFLPDVIVRVNNLEANEGAEARLILGGINTSVKTIIHDGSYQFYFDYIGLCNPRSWVAKLELDGKSYYLANPTEKEFSTPLDIEPSVSLEFTLNN